MTAAARLRALLDRPGLLVMPGCHDAMSARLIEEAGFELGFMSGFLPLHKRRISSGFSF